MTLPIVRVDEYETVVVDTYTDDTTIEVVDARTTPWTAMIVADAAFEFLVGSEDDLVSADNGMLWPAFTPLYLSVSPGEDIQLVASGGANVSVARVRDSS